MTTMNCSQELLLEISQKPNNATSVLVYYIANNCYTFLQLAEK